MGGGNHGAFIMSVSGGGRGRVSSPTYGVADDVTDTRRGDAEVGIFYAAPAAARGDSQAE